MLDTTIAHTVRIPVKWATDSATIWNARVKDALEDRLHQLVCRGDIDLPTAQREISSDWIGAYKKYFHTDKPVN
jgi:hypothetical protein